MFSINNENKLNAFTYISNKIKNDSTYLSHLNDIDEEKLAGSQLVDVYQDCNALDNWCRKYLTEKQFNALRAALRKRQSRKTKDNTAIELDRETYSDLNDLAAASGMTLKSYLTMLIEDKYNEIKPPVALHARKRRSLNKTPIKI